MADLKGVVLKCNDLCKDFRHINALTDVTMEIDNGFSLLLGPNGSGKSTLLRVAMGLLKPTRGSIRVLGLNPFKQGIKLREKVGFAPDPPAIPRWICGHDYFKFIASLRDARDPKLEVRKVAKLFELHNYLNRPVGEYSAGMLRRFWIAQAFLGDPELIILDEPLANLDAESIDITINILKENKSSRAFIVASHITSSLTDLIDNLAILLNGSLLDHGPLRDLAIKYSALALIVHTEEPETITSLFKKEGIKADYLIKDSTLAIMTEQTGRAKKLLNNIGFHELREDILLETITSKALQFGYKGVTQHARSES